MKITITPENLCDLVDGDFTLEACKVICNYCDEMSGNDFAPRIGDITTSFGEIPTEWAEEENDEHEIIATLNNGNSVIIY